MAFSPLIEHTVTKYNLKNLVNLMGIIMYNEHMCSKFAQCHDKVQQFNSGSKDTRAHAKRRDTNINYGQLKQERNTLD